MISRDIRTPRSGGVAAGIDDSLAGLADAIAEVVPAEELPDASGRVQPGRARRRGQRADVVGRWQPAAWPVPAGTVGRDDGVRTPGHAWHDRGRGEPVSPPPSLAQEGSTRSLFHHGTKAHHRIAQRRSSGQGWLSRPNPASADDLPEQPYQRQGQDPGTQHAWPRGHEPACIGVAPSARRGQCLPRKIPGAALQDPGGAQPSGSKDARPAVRSARSRGCAGC